MTTVFIKRDRLGEIVSIPDDVMQDLQVMSGFALTGAPGDEAKAIVDRVQQFLKLVADTARENDEKEKIVDNLTDEQEEKLKEEHAEDYHGTDDDMPDAYESWLEDLTLEDYKKILNL